MTITAIKAQVKHPDRISIFVDGAYSFSLNANQLLELRLMVGKEVSVAELSAYKEASNYGKLLERCLNYVLIRPRSRKEVVDYLYRKQADQTVAEKILQYLENKNYIDDKRFAEAWVRSRELTKASSNRKLQAELIQKGVQSSIIGEVLANRASGDAEAIRMLIAKKRKIIRYQDDQKLLRYLVGQGFAYSDVKNALSSTED